MEDRSGNVYVAYRRGLITGFSKIIPDSEKYFYIDALKVEDIKDQMRKENFGYLIVRDNKPSYMSVMREGVEEGYISLNMVAVQLMSEAITDVNSANDDIETITKGNSTVSRLETQFLE